MCSLVQGHPLLLQADTHALLPAAHLPLENALWLWLTPPWPQAGDTGAVTVPYLPWTELASGIGADPSPASEAETGTFPGPGRKEGLSPRCCWLVGTREA